ncbi:MAG: SIMPL domain-containing protein, partial [Eubacteriales bacterium]|nr:SIMPL domain-containing protein [Eubacteriales bacterium]
QGADAKTAKDENTKLYNQAVEFFKSEGISESSLQTENVYLNPVYDWSGNTQQLTGYTMVTDLSVSDIPIDQLSGLLDKAVDAGINGIQSVNYMCSAYDEKYNEALQLAVENAKSKADAIAAAGGVTAGTLQSVSEYGANTTPRYTNALSARSMAVNESGSADMAVMPGELEITARISASFEIK